MTDPAPTQPTPTTDAWTTRRLLAWMTDAFTRQQLDSPRLSAEILLSHTLRCERLKLYLDPDRPCDGAELARLRSLVGRALKHEPVQYLTGEAWFFGLPLNADARALIPRPCTEAIVEHVLQTLRTHTGDQPPLVSDVCTGSGCIAVAIARRAPAVRLLASDVSADALALAADNAARHGVADRVTLLQGDLLEPVRVHLAALGEAGQAMLVDHVVANPPYIPDHEWPDVPPNVRRHEPELALRAPPDGMGLIKRLIDDAPPLLRPGGTLMIEIAACNAAAVAALAAASPLLIEQKIVKDLEGLDRFLLARRTSA